jgi:hypothetical protein
MRSRFAENTSEKYLASSGLKLHVHVHVDLKEKDRTRKKWCRGGVNSLETCREVKVGERASWVAS